MKTEDCVGVTINVPIDLDAHTKLLVVNFAQAMARKLYVAELKYGYADGWLSPKWMDECRQNLREHLEKGDPVDVANYCAFLWYHKEPTSIAGNCEKVKEGE